MSADDIAYSTYDLEDAFKAGLLSPLNLYSTVDRMNSIEARKTFYAKMVDNVKAVYRAAKAKAVRRRRSTRCASSSLDSLMRQDAQFEAALPVEPGAVRDHVRRSLLQTDIRERNYVMVGK